MSTCSLPISVLLWQVPGAGRIPGGHTTQFTKTATHLAQRGVTVRTTNEVNPDLSGVDIVHGFGIEADLIRRCRENGIPVCLSTIYWSKAYRTGTDRGFKLPVLPARVRTASRLMVRSLQGRHIESAEESFQQVLSQIRAFEAADLLLPNSSLEGDAIHEELLVTTPRIAVANGYDTGLFTVGPISEVSRDLVLYVGRIEPHKNQLGLIHALRSSNYHLMIVGPPHPDHSAYLADCRKAAGRQVTILAGVPHDQLPPLYRRAKVHVVPSWFETTGLASLEAAACGANIVTTSRGFAVGYFGAEAWYCDPERPRSIKDAIDAAWMAEAPISLMARISRDYSWSVVAEQTESAYRWLLHLRARRA